MSTEFTAFVDAYRGDFVEDHHRISLAAFSPSGDLLFHAGNPELRVAMRSSAKPFQALALFQSGAFESFRISLKELALCCASHEGSKAHIEVAQGILAKIGLDETALNCGAHLPSDKDSRALLKEKQQEPSAIYNNCSGKHSGMLAVAKALAASPAHYEHPDHPVQKLIFKIVKDLTQETEIPFGIDGCSAPNFILPLSAAARMWSSLAAPQLFSGYQQGLERVFAAMQAHPEMVAGEGAIDTVLMRAIPTLAAKRGAQGYYGLALKDSNYGPLGLVLKVEDGNSEAREVFVTALLEHLGVLPSGLALPWRRPEIKNHRGIVTGYWQASFSSEFRL